MVPPKNAASLLPASSIRCLSAPAQKSARKSVPCPAFYQQSVDQIVEGVPRSGIAWHPRDHSFRPAGRESKRCPRFQARLQKPAWYKQAVESHLKKAKLNLLGDYLMFACASTPTTGIAASWNKAKFRTIRTLEILAQTGRCPMLVPGPTSFAPSDMMDGRVAAIRTLLEQPQIRKHSHSCLRCKNTAPVFTARSAKARRPPHRSPATARSYQMDPANCPRSPERSVARLGGKAPTS